jgi:uncharacterized protein YecT (DUF1311 family)
MRAALSLLILALSPIAFSAQSFNCKLAQTPREKAVCADTRLSALDAEIATNYKALRAQLSPESAALVTADQREWLHWIDLVCPPNGKGASANQTQCLQMQYFTRAHDFGKTAHLGNTVIFPRAHFLYKAGNANSPNPINPGFGYGSLRWPQIDIKPDKPNAAYTTFNSTARTRAGQLAIGFSNNNTATFDTAVDASGSIDAYFTIDAANDRLIDVTFTDGAYPWGAAHPTANRTSFLWWLDQNRQLTATDIFWTDSGWQQNLVPLAVASLQSNADIKNMLWKGDQFTKAVRSAVPEPANWTVTRNGLTITFGQYAVGPYVIGMPQAHLTWTQLTPMLAHGFNPSILPPPIPKPNP